MNNDEPSFVALKNNKKRFPFWQMLVTSVVFLVLGVWLGRWFANQPTLATTTQQKPVASVKNNKVATLSVEVIRANLTQVQQRIPAQGLIVGKDILPLTPRSSGLAVEKVWVQAGDYVKQGQVLASFDQRQQQQQLKQSHADVVEAQARLAQAKADLARVVPLLKDDAVSRQEVDSYRTAQKQAEAALRAAQARQEAQVINVKNSQLIAPVSGLIESRKAEVGVLTSGEPLFQLIKYGAMEWQANLSPVEASKIAIGTTAVVNLPNNTSVTGRVERISANVNQSREMTVHVSLQASPAIKSGLLQRGEFLVGEQRGIAIPLTAISRYDGRDYVWQVKAVERDIYQVQRVPIQIVQYLEQQAIVVEISPSMLLVKQSVQFLNDGDYVRVVNSAGQIITTDQMIRTVK